MYAIFQVTFVYNEISDDKLKSPRVVKSAPKSKMNYKRHNSQFYHKIVNVKRSENAKTKILEIESYSIDEISDKDQFSVLQKFLIKNSLSNKKYPLQEQIKSIKRLHITQFVTNKELRLIGMLTELQELIIKRAPDLIDITALSKLKNSRF